MCRCRCVCMWGNMGVEGDGQLCSPGRWGPDGVHAAVQMYLYVGNWKFKVMERKEVERQAVALRMTALDGNRKSHEQKPQNGASHHDESTLHDLENGAHQAISSIKELHCRHTKRPQLLSQDLTS